MAARRGNHRRPLADPHHIGDAFANGADLQDHEDWVRLVFWAEMADDSDASRRKAASIVMPRSALDALMQELRGSFGGEREARRH